MDTATDPTTGDDIDALALARLWSHGHPPASLVAAFDDWLEATGLRDVRGVDPLDLFYWEHRLATWHSNICLESDFAWDTHALVNSRAILKLMLSIPDEDRRSGALIRELLSVLWPELLRWPFGIPRRRSLRAAVRRRLPF